MDKEGITSVHHKPSFKPDFPTHNELEQFMYGYCSYFSSTKEILKEVNIWIEPGAHSFLLTFVCQTNLLLKHSQLKLLQIP